MALTHPSSCECVDTGLDLFIVPPTQTSVEDGLHIEHFPLATLAEGAPIEFAVNGSGEEYVDLHNTFLHVKVKVVREDGTPLVADAEVAPVTYLLHSLFSQVDISLNDVLVTNASNCYAYRAYLEALLGRGADAKQAQLTAALYYQDTRGHMDAVAGDENLGLVKRRELASQSKVMDLMGKLHTDLMSQTRYILNGVDIKFRLIPSSPRFHLMLGAGQANCRTIITHASMFVRKIKLNPGVLLAHAKALSKTSAKYPMNRVVMKNFSIPAGNLSCVQDNLFMNQIPNRLTLAIVDSAAFSGGVNRNPFHFKTKNLNYLALHLDGKQIPSKPLTPNFETGQSIRAYYNTITSLGYANKGDGCGLDREDFQSGFTVYTFDLTPSLLDGDAFELVKSGSLRVELKFAIPLDQPVMVLIYAEQDSILEITASRQVLTDFTV
jgi:hypothetical protein